MQEILENKKYIDCNVVKQFKKGNIISISENNRNYIAYIKNNSIVYRLSIDPNNIKQKIGIILEGKKCDYGMFAVDSKILYLIELKGCNVDDAFEQLYITYKWFIKNTKSESISKFRFRVVASKVRSVPALNKNRNMLVKNGINKNAIVVKENELEEPDKI